MFNTLLSIGLADIFELLDHNVLLHDKELEGDAHYMVFFDDRPKAIDVGPETYHQVQFVHGCLNCGTVTGLTETKSAAITPCTSGC